MLKYLLSLPLLCSASTWVPDLACEGTFNGIDLTPYVGLVFGTHREYVFNPDDPTSHYKLSELTWKAHNLSVLGWRTQFNCIADRLHFLFNGWAFLNDTQSTMTDRDWSNINQEGPTDISWTGSRLTNAFKLVGEIDYDFLFFRFNFLDFKVGALFGYEFLNMRWDDHAGGHHWYDNGADIGEDPAGESTIFYGQQYSIPYLGMQLNFVQKQCWGLRFFGKGTWFASAKDNDLHSGTSVYSIDHFGSGSWMQVGTELHWYFWKGLGLDFSYSFEKMNRRVGSTIDFDPNEGKSYAPNIAGISYYQNEFTLGLKGSF